jgi:DNA modification methylase
MANLGDERKPVNELELTELTQDPNNARRHSERNVTMISDAIADIGAARSIVIDEQATVLAGNATVIAAARAGIRRVRVVDASADELIAVRRTGLTPDEKARLSIYDNRAAELATWDPATIVRLQDQLENFDPAAFWNDAEFRALLADLQPEEGLTDADAVPGLRATDIREGDLFELGEHRLLCGDSTSAADVGRLLAGERPFLMATDPPYGVQYDPTWRNRAGVSDSDRTGKVANDDRADWSAAWRLFTGDVAYVWHAGLYASVVEASLRAAALEPRAQIIWRKARFVLSRGHYHWQHEPCWYAVRSGASARWCGSRTEATVWNIAGVMRCAACGALLGEGGDHTETPTTVWDIGSQDDSGKTTHGTQKPVECMARPMRNHGTRGDVVYEPFNGSGSSLIAAEQLGRRLRAIELMPTYVQQALDRWEQFTGRKALKVGGR